MTDDIVARLRRHQCVTGIRTVIDDAADEIERLRRNTGCARDQRSTQFCGEALDAQREVERLRAERDEARREVARLLDVETGHRIAIANLTAERDEARMRMGRILNEIDCRVQHGADSNGHLESVLAMFGDGK